MGLPFPVFGNTEYRKEEMSQIWDEADDREVWEQYRFEFRHEYTTLSFEEWLIECEED